ncbi:MAG: hypothetical protein FWB72_05995 [Firmicutes bacterium]|nr:hypothetical protein [Bacillota bacterium]
MHTLWVNNKKSIKLAMFFVGTIIGAGFASGRELLTYFLPFGTSILPFIALLGLFFFVSAYLYIKVGQVHKPTNIEDFNKLLFGKASIVFNYLIILSYFVFLSTMLAGLDSLSKVAFPNIRFPIFSLLSVFIAIVIVARGASGILNVNFVVIPFIILIIVAVCVYSLTRPLPPPEYLIPHARLTPFTIASMLSHIALYIGTNMLLAGGALAKFSAEGNEQNLGDKIQNYSGQSTDNSFLKKLNNDSIKASLLGGVFIGVLVAIFILALFLSHRSIVQEDIPLIFLSHDLPAHFIIVIYMVLFAAIITSLCSALFASSHFVNDFIKHKPIAITLTALLGYIISRFGFNFLITYFYPLLGVIGLVYIARLIVVYFSKTKNSPTETGLSKKYYKPNNLET